MKKTLAFIAVILGVLIVAAALFPEQATRHLVDAERWRSDVAHKTVSVGDQTWHYLEGGPTDADTVLLLHGFGGDKDNWTRFARWLTPRYRVIAPDLPGFGESARHPDWDYSLPRQLERVNAFVAALRLERMHLVGNSMGGHLAALYTLAYPEEIRSLGLFNNSGLENAVAEDFERALQGGGNPLIVETTEDFDRLLDFAAHEKPFVPWPVKGVLARQARDNAEFNQYIFGFLARDSSSLLEPVLSNISAPALILWGEYDRLLDVASVGAMRPLLPQAEVVVMEETGHLPMIERPRETAAHYLAFIDSF